MLGVESVTQATRSLCKTCLEQAYLNLEDLVHFLEVGSDALKVLSNGEDSNSLLNLSFALIS